MELVEPLGWLHGEPARAAVDQGAACWLGGGPLAFALLRRLATGGIVQAGKATAETVCLTSVIAPWAGLPIGRPLVMGVINTTTDSFSDPGRFVAATQAIAAGRDMAEAGADIIDVGGESTRPGAGPTPPEHEQARVLPVIRALAQAGCVVSIDTRNAATMAAALDAGARIVNDVSALAHDPASPALLARRRCPVILMHMRGTPATMQRLTQYDDVAAQVTLELAERMAVAEAAGIVRSAIAVDPGIGFAKGPGQNEALLARLPVLLNLGCRIVVGVSRKGFIGRMGAEPDPLRRLPGSLAAGLFALLGGASILRVHDVAETAQAVRVLSALVDYPHSG